MPIWWESAERAMDIDVVELRTILFGQETDGWTFARSNND